MKKHSKLIFVILTALILLFSYSAIFGINKYVGGVTIKITKSIKDIKYDKDIKGGVESTFFSKQNIENEAYESIALILKHRLKNMGVDDSLVDIYYLKNYLTLNIGIENDLIEFDKEMLEQLTSNPKVEFKLGEKKDGEVLLTLSDIYSSETEYIDQIDAYALQINLLDIHTDNSPSAAYRFGEITKKYVNSDLPITIWIDDKPILPIWIDEVIEDGYISIVDSSLSEDEAINITNKLGCKYLPAELTLESFNYNSYNYQILYAEMLMKIIVIVLILASIFLIFNYRLSGLVSSILMLGLYAFEISLFTGLFEASNAFLLSISDTAGILLVILISLITNISLNHRIREELILGRSLDDAINSSFKYTLSLRVKINCLVIVIGILIIAAFDTNTGTLSKIFNFVFFFIKPTPNTHMHSFGLTLSFGAFINFILVGFLNAPMIKSLSNFRSFKNKTLFGGNYEE